MPRRRSFIPAAIPVAHECSLLDLVDNLLNKGVVLSGELTLGIGGVDLIYARLAVLLCAADHVLPGGAA